MSSQDRSSSASAIEPMRPPNELLRALTAEQYEHFAPYLTRIELPLKHVLVEANVPAPEVCFMISGLASMVAANDEETIEISHIGREGVTSVHLVTKADRTPNRTFMQIAGAGYTMPAERFTDILDTDIGIRSLFLRYVQTCALQLAHSALANGRYSICERLARWLLMVHDRTDGDDLPLTHEFLSLMLGVRRSGVTDQIHILEGMKAIKATRGNIRIIDREKLKEVAGRSYGIPEQEYERLIGLPISRRG